MTIEALGYTRFGKWVQKLVAGEETKFEQGRTIFAGKIEFVRSTT